VEILGAILQKTGAGENTGQTIATLATEQWKGTTKDDSKAAARIVWQHDTTCFEPHKLLDAVRVLQRSSDN
jgi:hypothetical protein